MPSLRTKAFRRRVLRLTGSASCQRFAAANRQAKVGPAFNAATGYFALGTQIPVLDGRPMSQFPDPVQADSLSVDSQVLTPRLGFCSRPVAFGLSRRSGIICRNSYLIGLHATLRIALTTVPDSPDCISRVPPRRLRRSRIPANPTPPRPDSISSCCFSSGIPFP